MSEIRYQIEMVKAIDAEELASFSILYAPLLSPLAYQLYLLMSGIMQSHGRIKNARFLCETLHCTPLELTQAREELEKFMLLRTYENEEKHLILQLLPIKRGFKFLNHEVLGRYYLMKMGSKAYQFAQLCFKDPNLSLDGYKNVTQVFDANELKDWKKEEENEFQTYRIQSKKEKGFFDMSKFLKKCTRLIFPNDQRTKENLETIENMGNYYHVSCEDMIEFVGKAIPSKTMVFSAEKFKDLIRRKYLPLLEENDSTYHMKPVVFLRKLQKGVLPSKVDARLLEDLSTQYKLKDEVINIMIEYILKNNENRLDRNYVEKVASVWVRNQIDSEEKALEACSPKEKKVVKKRVERKLPDWYKNEEEDYQEASEDEINEFKKMIEELENHGKL